MSDAIYIDTEKIDEAYNYAEKAYNRLIKDNIELIAQQLLQIEGITDLKNYTYIKNINQEISNIVSKAKKVKEEYEKLKESSEEVTKISFPTFNQGIVKGKTTKSTGQIMTQTPTDSVVNVKTDQSLQYNVISESGYDEETITMVIEGLDEAIEKTKHKNDMAFEDEKRISELLSKEPEYLFNTDKMNFAVTTEEDFEEIYQEAKELYPNKFTKETYKGLTEEEKTQFIKDLAEQKLSEKYQEHKAQFPNEWPENSYEELSQERKEEFLSLQATYRKVEIDTEIEENEVSIASINYQKKQMEIALEVSKYEECIENADFEKYSKENEVEVEERYKEELRYLSEAQQLVLTYIYSKEGKTKADEYIDSLSDQINKYKAAEEANEFIEKLENNPDELLEELENMGLTVKEGTKDGVNQYVEGLKNLYQNNYEPSVVEYKQMIVLEMLNKKPEWKTLLPETYQISSSIGNMAPSIIISIGVTAATGGAGSPAVFSNMGRILGALSMGASATGNAKHQALMDGASICEAWAYGITTGASETMLEYFLGSIPGIGKLGNKSAKTLTESIKVLGEKAVSEGIEEGLQQIIQTFSAEIIYGKEVNIDELMNETWDAATSGAICSIIMNTGSSIMYKGQQVILSEADRQAINNYLNQNTDEGSEQAYSYLKNLLTNMYNTNLGIVAPGFQYAYAGVPAEYSTNINQFYINPNSVDVDRNEFVAISDFHGEQFAMDKLTEHYLDEYNNIYNLGDITDRGDDGVSMLLQQMELAKKYPNRVHYLPGNHDSFIYGMYYAKDAQQRAIYRKNLEYNGGAKTIQDLENLRINNPQKFNELMNFLGSQPLQQVSEFNGKKYCFAHAFFNQTIYNQNPNYNLKNYMNDVNFTDKNKSSSSPYYILWFRKKKNSYNPADLPSSEYTMVVGHTPNATDINLGDVKVVCVDGGANKVDLDGNKSIKKFDGGAEPIITVKGYHNDTSGKGNNKVNTVTRVTLTDALDQYVKEENAKYNDNNYAQKLLYNYVYGFADDNNITGNYREIIAEARNSGELCQYLGLNPNQVAYEKSLYQNAINYLNSGDVQNAVGTINQTNNNKLINKVYNKVYQQSLKLLESGQTKEALDVIRITNDKKQISKIEDIVAKQVTELINNKKYAKANKMALATQDSNLITAVQGATSDEVISLYNNGRKWKAKRVIKTTQNPELIHQFIDEISVKRNRK